VSIAKGSLHASGHCFFSFTAQHHAQMLASGNAREKRAFTRWQRLPTPNAGLVNVVSLLFAAEYLSQNGSRVEPDTALIEAPKAGQAVVIDLIFGRGGRVLPQSNQHQIGHVALSSGEEFFVIAGLVDDFDAQSFRQRHQPFAEDTEIGFLQEPQTTCAARLCYRHSATACFGLSRLAPPTSHRGRGLTGERNRFAEEGRVG
jgi:hypothetical protein